MREIPLSNGVKNPVAQWCGDAPGGLRGIPGADA